MSVSAQRQETWLFLARAGFEDSLQAEILDRLGGRAVVSVEAPGVVRLFPRPAASLSPPFVFEMQRLPDADFVSASRLKPISDETFRRLMGGLSGVHGPWTSHAFAHAENATPDLHRRMAGIEKVLLRLTKREWPGLFARYRDAARDAHPPCRVLQLCLLPDGLWYALSDPAGLTSRLPAGRCRLRMDRRAPSRSFLKIEEAFLRMGCFPQAGERVVDLGAAPGGWTFAFLKRGCDVLAVDNGPLKLPPAEPGWGRVSHERRDGTGFEPPSDWLPVDWLAADMLISPGVALGLLRKWTSRRWARRFIVNVKLPQRQPHVAVAPLVAFLRRARGLRAEVRQLYHDRREVTVMGVMERYRQVEKRTSNIEH